MYWKPHVKKFLKINNNNKNVFKTWKTNVNKMRSK